jgi:hypothetical protein
LEDRRRADHQEERGKEDARGGDERAGDAAEDIAEERDVMTIGPGVTCPRAMPSMNVFGSTQRRASTTSRTMMGTEANPPPNASRSIRSMSSARLNNVLSSRNRASRHAAAGMTRKPRQPATYAFPKVTAACAASATTSARRPPNAEAAQAAS